MSVASLSCRVGTTSLASESANDAPAVLEVAACEAQTWNLTDIYPDEPAFAADRARLEPLLSELERWRGRIGENSAALAEALDEIYEAGKLLTRLHAYASLRADTDLRVAVHQAARQEIEIAWTEYSRRTAFVRPELLEIPDESLLAWLESEPRLDAYGQMIRTLVRQRPHVLPSGEERIVAEASLVASGPSNLHGILLNAELPRPSFTLDDGTAVTLTPAEFSRWRTGDRRGERERLFSVYYGAYAPFRETLGTNLFEALKGHLFRSRVRRYDSCLAAALDPDNVPLTVYGNLVERVRSNLPLLDRYYALRARALGIEGDLAYHDLHCPIVGGPVRRYAVAEAGNLVREAMEPLGALYSSALAEAFDRRWIDWHPGPGKRSGAYASGSAYDVHPYMLLNFNGDYDAVSTLAHEAGHAMHSYFSNRAQPYPRADYSIFVAEVASTFNEALLHEAAWRRAGTRDERVFLLGTWLDGLRATLFRQTFFAEFEREIHERTERGEALTGEALGEIYLGMLRFHQGHDRGACRVDPIYAVEWAAVPHFYYDFYVYQYATGIVAATCLAQRVLSGAPGARDRYLAFLSSGGSADPLDLLRSAGVDLESAEPYDETFAAMARKLEELERAL